MLPRLVLLLVIPLLALCHHHGGNDTDCWLNTPSYPLCLTSPATIRFQLTTPNTNTPSASPTVNDQEIFNDQTIAVSSNLVLVQNFTLVGIVTHWNLHACVATVGWCTPDVARTPSLVTETSPLSGDTVFFAANLSGLTPGKWNIIAHYEFSGSLSVGSTANQTQPYSVSAGFLLTVNERSILLLVDSAALGVINALAWLGLLLAIATALGILKARQHWAFRAASPWLSTLIASGCALAFATVFIFTPTSSNATCAARPFLICLAYDAILVPLGLKTWRVACLFNTASFQRLVISDQRLWVIILCIVTLDLILIIVWSQVAPLVVGNVPSLANPSAVFIQNCICAAQSAWEATLIIYHLLPLLWVALQARRVRLYFIRRTSILGAKDDLRMAKFNESEAVSLSLVGLIVTSSFALALQFTVNDSPTAQTLMVCGGIIWSAFFILIVMFAPKFVALAMFEKDGITRRKSSSMASSSSTTRESNLPRPPPTPTKNSPSADFSLL